MKLAMAAIFNSRRLQGCKFAGVCRPINRVGADLDHMALRTKFRKIALVMTGVLLSIPMAASLEDVLHNDTPGTRLVSVLFHGHPDLSDLGVGLLVQVGLDSALCFAVMCGLYALYSKL